MATDLATICPAEEEPIEIGERPQSLLLCRLGSRVTALAHHPALQLPEGTDFVLSLDHLTLAAGNGDEVASHRRSNAFLGRRGHGGGDRQRAMPGNRQVAPDLVPGESVLVERNRLVKLENNGNEPGSVLLLGLLPPEGQLPIGPFGAPANIWIPFPEEREQLTHRQMLSGEIGGWRARRRCSSRHACTGPTPAAEIAPTRYPGPVGFWCCVARPGQRNRAHRCGQTAGSPQASRRCDIRAGEQAPDIVLFGALRTSAAAADRPEGSDASSSLDCAGPTRRRSYVRVLLCDA